MDNLTHSLVGLTAAKAGLEKLSPGATALCLLAANAPDADIVVLAFGDRWTFLQHHRGITHAIIGVIAIAFLLPLIFYVVDLVWARLKKQPPKTKLRGLRIGALVVFIVLSVKGARERWGAKIAFAAFAVVICYWGLLSVAHSTAVARGSDEAAQIASSNGEAVGRFAAMPRLANPLRWDVV